MYSLDLWLLKPTCNVYHQVARDNYEELIYDLYTHVLFAQLENYYFKTIIVWHAKQETTYFHQSSEMLAWEKYI